MAMKKQTMPMQGRVKSANVGRDIVSGIKSTAKAVGIVASAGKAIAQKATGNLPQQKRDKVNQAVSKAKNLGVAGGSAGVKKMAKKMRPKAY